MNTKKTLAEKIIAQELEAIALATMVSFQRALPPQPASVEEFEALVRAKDVIRLLESKKDIA